MIAVLSHTRNSRKHILENEEFLKTKDQRREEDIEFRITLKRIKEIFTLRRIPVLELNAL